MPEKPYRLIVKRPGSLESVALDVEINLAELEVIEAALEHFRRVEQIAALRQGIEQFQAEDR